MKLHPVAALMLLSLVFIFFTPPLFAETMLRDPWIPDGETAVYFAREGDKEFTYVEKVTVSEKDDRGVYSFLYTSDRENIEIQLVRKTMIPFSVRSVSRGNGLSIDSSTLVSFEKQIDTDGVTVLSFTDLPYILRGYPFGEITDDLEISFISTTDDAANGSADLAVKIHYDGIESLSVAGRTIECHRLELKISASGLMRVIKPFIPKTNFWFSAQGPHYLVAYEGSGGYPGSSRISVELIEYSGWN